MFFLVTFPAKCLQIFHAGVFPSVAIKGVVRLNSLRRPAFCAFETVSFLACKTEYLPNRRQKEPRISFGGAHRSSHSINICPYSETSKASTVPRAATTIAMHTESRRFLRVEFIRTIRKWHLPIPSARKKIKNILPLFGAWCIYSSMKKSKIKKEEQVVNLKLSIAVHAQLKAYCDKTGMKMGRAAGQMIERSLAEQ